MPEGEIKEQNIVKVEELVKVHANRIILNKLNLEIEKGVFYAIYGERKAGKSVLLNCILSLFPYEKGNITLFGEQMEIKGENIKRKTGVVLEQPAVFRELTVRGNLSYFASLYMEESSVSEKVMQAMEWMQLIPVQNLYPGKLSKGEVRRLDLACGAVHNPELLVVDEPAGHIEEESVHIIYEGLEVFHQKGGTVLMASSLRRQFEKSAARIGILDRGRIIAEGSSQTLNGMISLKETVVIRVKGLTKEQEKEIQALLGIGELHYQDEELIIRNKKGRNQIKFLMDYFQKKQVKFEEIYVKPPNLEDVYFEITGRKPEEG